MSEGRALPPLLPREITLLDVAFPAHPPLPAWEDIPEEFQRGNRWSEIANLLFFQGGKLSDHGLHLRPDIDGAMAMANLQACLGSFAPKHEHKAAGVGYLLSLWCDRIDT